MVGGDGGGSGGGGWDVASPGSRSIGFRSKKRQRRGKGTRQTRQGNNAKRGTHTHTANNDDQQKAKWGAPVQTTGTSRLVGNQPGYTQDPQTLVSSSTYNGDCSVRRSERANRHGRSTRGASCLRGRNRGRAGAKGDSLSLSLTYGRSTTVGFIDKKTPRGQDDPFSLSLSVQPRLHPVRRSRESPPRGIVIVSVVSYRSMRGWCTFTLDLAHHQPISRGENKEKTAHQLITAHGTRGLFARPPLVVTLSIRG